MPAGFACPKTSVSRCAYFTGRIKPFYLFAAGFVVLLINSSFPVAAYIKRPEIFFNMQCLMCNCKHPFHFAIYKISYLKKGNLLLCFIGKTHQQNTVRFIFGFPQIKRPCNARLTVNGAIAAQYIGFFCAITFLLTATALVIEAVFFFREQLMLTMHLRKLFIPLPLAPVNKLVSPNGFMLCTCSSKVPQLYTSRYCRRNPLF